MALAQETETMEGAVPGGQGGDAHANTGNVEIAFAANASPNAKEEVKGESEAAANAKSSKNNAQASASSLEDDKEMRELANEALKSMNGKPVSARTNFLPHLYLQHKCQNRTFPLTRVCCVRSRAAVWSSQRPQKSWTTIISSLCMCVHAQSNGSYHDR